MNNTKGLLDAALRLTEELVEKRQYQPATNFCRQIIRVNPKSPEAWFLLGVCMACQGQHQEAVDALDTAISLTPVEENKEHATKLKEKLLSAGGPPPR